MPPFDDIASTVDALPRGTVTRRARVMLLLGSLEGGGAERVAVNLFNRCEPRAVDVRLGLLQRKGPYLNEVDAARVTALPVHRGQLLDWARTPARLAGMIGQVRPDVLMTFGMGVDALTWPALKMMGSTRPRWICRQDSNPDAEIANLTSSRWARSIVAASTGRIHGAADGLVAVARDLATRVDRQTETASPRVQAIYNPIDIATIQSQAAEPLPAPMERPFIVSAGRLVRQKGYDVLIEAFANSAAATDMDLVILGQGPLEGALRAQAAALGVADRVWFPGFQINPWAWFARAHLFVLSSRWEGFGNVVAEALACGAPTLVTDCDYGPREQVDHAVSGWITRSEDPAAMTEALNALLSNDNLRIAMGVRGRGRAEAFDIEVIARAYTRLFLQVAWRNAAAGALAARPAHTGESFRAAAS